MPITGLPVTGDNNTVTVTPTGIYSVDAGGGVDTLVLNYAALSSDIIYEYAGNGYYRFTDYLSSSIDFYSFERFNLRGGSGDDDLRGANDVDQLYGGAGADSLTSGLGADTINGGAGFDRWTADYGSVTDNVLITLSVDPAITQLVAATGARFAQIETLTITTGIGDDVINTSAFVGNDNITTGDGDDQVDGGRGVDWVNGGAGTDILAFDWSAITDPSFAIRNSYVSNGWYRYSALSGDQVNYINFERYFLTGGAGSDGLSGGALADRLTGNGGNDSLIGGTGADTVAGGAGIDLWQVDLSDSEANTSVSLISQTTNTGAVISGIERLSYTGSAFNDTVVALAGSYNDSFTMGASDDTVTTGRGVDSANGEADEDLLVMDWSGITDATQGISRSYVSNGWYCFSAASGDRLDYINFERFYLTGGAGGDYLLGAGLNDRLVGNGGDDTLSGGGGVDVITGGDGVDLWEANLSEHETNVTINFQTQTTSYGAAISGLERLNYTGTAVRDLITTRSGVYNDNLYLGAGNDSATVWRGVDAVNGAEGEDTLILDWSGIAGATQGITYSYVSNGWYRFSSTSGDQVDFINIEHYDMTGGAGHDSLVGGTMNDTLRGGAGNDTLESGAGRAVIDGGAGTDLWRADLSAISAGLRFSASASQTAAQATGSGCDVRNIEQVSLTGGAGADLVDTTSQSGNDWFAGNAGNDTVSLGLGQDGFDGGVGVDLLILDYSASTEAIQSRYTSNGWNRYGEQGDAHYTDYINVERFNVSGGAGADTLIGAGAADTLSGGAGNDWLNGAAGADRINGGEGVDTWQANYAGVTVAIGLTLNAAGAATVTGAGTVLTGIEAVSLTTGQNADTINLSAGSGNDAVATNEGNDTVNLGRGWSEWADGGAGTDSLTLNASLATSGLRTDYVSNGAYHIYATDGSYDATFNNFETYSITGSARNDRIYTFGGNDRISTGTGNDILNGGDGNDTLLGGAGADLFQFTNLYGCGVDTIADGASGDRMRLYGVTLSAISDGAGTTLGAGQVAVSSAGGVTTLAIGLDGTAGADLTIWLTGSFTAASFSLSGSDIIFV
ncbi:hemolysin type calcium-binding protein [Rhodobacter viridis]|uniref:Hemolysin type calcium-binding protein n=1 Tax=Rhodobacter viridis TaxID=1054202 RepID=A0A318TRI7_9RHOB|nr:calcium-binding protein [Rhodobacter viridis]PYF07451.1 hemolysin type calcium-binding protein [Rhodobacter viridis]